MRWIISVSMLVCAFLLLNLNFLDNLPFLSTNLEISNIVHELQAEKAHLWLGGNSASCVKASRGNKSIVDCRHQRYRRCFSRWHFVCYDTSKWQVGCWRPNVRGAQNAHHLSSRFKSLMYDDNFEYFNGDTNMAEIKAFPNCQWWCVFVVN